MSAVSRERLTSAATSDAVAPTYLHSTVGLPPHVFCKSVHGRTVHVMTRRLSHSEGVHRVPLTLHASLPEMGLEVGGYSRRRQG